MQPTKQARREARQLLRLCYIDGVLDEGRGLALLQRIRQANPRGCLPVLAHFQRLLKLAVAQHAAKIETATPLSSDVAAALRARVEGAYGPGLDVSFVHDPALIGGMRVTVGSDVYDGSVQTRLGALDARFSKPLAPVL